MLTSIRRATGLIGLALMVASCASAASPVTSPRSSGVQLTASPSAGASASPAAVASPHPSTVPELTAVFTSPTMGYSVRYPSAWVATPATEPWLPDSPNFWDDPVGDRLESGSAGFRGTSQALAKGQTADAWLGAYFGSSPSCGDPEQVPVGNQVGTIDLNGCRGKGRLGGKVFDIALVVGGRGYNFTMEGAVDHHLFLDMLATVRFAPESAIDTSR